MEGPRPAPETKKTSALEAGQCEHIALRVCNAAADVIASAEPARVAINASVSFSWRANGEQTIAGVSLPKRARQAIEPSSLSTAVCHPV
jgi:hypothetical protein